MADMTQSDILHMRLATEYLRMLDAIRRDEADIPTRSEMVRRLIERAMQKTTGKTKK